MARLKQDEASVWAELSRYRPSGVTAHRIETQNPPGVSDVYWTSDEFQWGGNSGWIELKSQVSEIRKEQRIWLRGLRAHGINAVVLCHWKDHMYLIHPMQIGLDLKLNYDIQGGQVMLKVPRSDLSAAYATLWDLICRRTNRSIK